MKNHRLLPWCLAIIFLVISVNYYVEYRNYKDLYINEREKTVRLSAENEEMLIGYRNLEKELLLLNQSTE